MNETVPEHKQEEVLSPEISSVNNENNSVKEELIMVVKSKSNEKISTEDETNNEDTSSVKSESEGTRTDSEVEAGDEGDDDDDDDASVVLEREEGDGQESTPNRKVDDDEDKRNPQYIPKRGTFYEHDDRTAVDDETEVVETEDNERLEKEASKKKVWSEKEASRWCHDKFNDQDQAPKSKAELISIYGYDIRNEEGPPRARRRRRYGRGPNKYTRNWEDEDAYSKLTTAPVKSTVRKPKSRDEEYPPLERGRAQSRSSERPDTAASGDSEQNKIISTSSPENGNYIHGVDAPREISPPLIQRAEQPIQIENGDSKIQKQTLPKREFRNIPKSSNIKPRQEESNHGMSNSRGVTRTRGFKSGGRGDNRNRTYKNQDDNTEYIMSQNFTNRSINQPTIHDLEKELPNMSLQETYNRGNNKFNGPRQTSVPPRLQGEQRGSKRYSSLRQRSLPETAPAPTFPQQQRAVLHYPPEYGPQNPQQNQQGMLPHPATSIVSQVPTNSTQQLITVQPSTQSMGPIPHQGPANGGGQMMQAPPQYANPYPQAPPAFLPGVAPPTFLPQQAPPPQIINFAQPPQFPQPGYSNFQHQQFTPVNPPQPTELYQPQGGITYYSTQNQQLMPTRVPTKRPKAAIPIIPPPEHKEPRGRGRLNQGEDSPVGASDIQQDAYEMDNNGIQYMNDVIVQQ